MTQRAIAILTARLVSEEGSKLTPYDDATGRAVLAPVGNISWGFGFNLMQCGSPGLFAVMADHLLGVVEATLNTYDWYHTLDGEPTRQSVFLDIAYNAGVHGLLHFPKMIGHAVAKEWQACALECTVIRTNPGLDHSRYAPLRALIIAGDSAL